MTEIQNRLFKLKDAKYLEFNSKLIPTVDKDLIIGVRVPALRTLSRELCGTEQATQFMRDLPHAYLEENLLHGLLIERMRDFDICICELERLLPYVDNWAVCDCISPKIFARNTDKLYVSALKWLNSDHPYTVRYGIGMLMKYFLDERFSSEHAQMIARISNEHYYIQMMIAWYFATALAKQYDCAVTFLEKSCLAPRTHNTAIRKAIESYRVTDEHKQYLRSLVLPGGILKLK